MKRLFIGAVGSCMLIFIIWSIVAYVNYGSDIVNYRLDLYSTFSKFSLSIENKFDVSLFDMLKDFKNGISNFLSYSLTAKAISAVGGNVSEIPFGFQLLLTAVNGLLTPLWSIVYSIYVLVYLVAIVFELVVYVISFLEAVYEFILYPVFIHV